jgi:hypothetical protein
MGAGTIAIYLGSQVHELARIGFKAGASGYLDTLDDVRQFGNPHEDRYFYAQIPHIGVDVDFGKKDFPVYSNFSFEYAKNRLIYVTKVLGYGLWDGYPPAGREDGNEDVLVGDSISWKWQTLGNIKLNPMLISPALLLSYWRNEIIQWQPTKENDHLLIYERERNDSSWKYSSFTFGIGTAAQFKEYAKLSFEFNISNLKLEYGDGYSHLSDQKETYPRILVGLEGYGHGISALNLPESIELTLRMGFLYLKENSRFNTYSGDEFSKLNLRVTPLSQYNRYIYYDPQSGWVQENTIARFGFGLGASFLRKMFGANLFMAFPSKKTAAADFKGFEFGVDLVYCLRPRKENQKAPDDVPQDMLPEE